MSYCSTEASVRLDQETALQFLDGVHARDRVSGLTHAFYRYPARFSPRFARAAIEAFTSLGDLVLDPFMGGGTTLVEAQALHRNAIGLDINSLSCFIAKAKTTLLSDDDLTAIRTWTTTTVRLLNMRRPAKRASDWIARGYQRNISTRQTWPIRKSLEIALHRVPLLESVPRERFARALLLRTAQWALDCRRDVPTVSQFRASMMSFMNEMLDGVISFREASIQGTDANPIGDSSSFAVVLNQSAERIDQDSRVTAHGPPRLVLTSPPYPGVHVMYHRWQVLGRRETPAPFWITDSLDGNGLSYYTFGHRLNPGLTTYFEAARASFTSLARVADTRTLFVQMVAFSDASWQLPEYLSTMQLAGLVEIHMPDLANASDGRLWRNVPNRKWYADQRGHGAASREVVLFHRKSMAR
jgi:hypothetical protein